MMHSSDKNNSTSIGDVLFHAAVQLTAATVTSTDSITTRYRSNSANEESPSARKTISPFSFSFRKHSHLNKRKIGRDTTLQSSPIQSVPHKTSPHPIDFQAKIPTTLTSSPSKDYLSPPKPYEYSRSTSNSPTKPTKSIKNTFLGIWQGLNSDEIQSSTSLAINPKHFEERVKKTTPRWRAFSKVVTSLLTFTRTKKEQYEWIQLVGHPGTFKEGIHDGYVLKELCEHERDCCELLKNDILKEFVPKYNGIVKDEEGKFYIEMEDLLASFHEPCIMDCKIGVRTYLEEELDKSERKPEPRADLYDKMIALDPLAATDQENEDKKLLKPRYMIWRESLSSTQDLGFRIEAIKKSRDLMSKEFQRIKERNDVKNQLCEFIADSLPRATSYHNRLIELRSACGRSKFIQTHELIGSSILFVHDKNKASLWMIDFGKTRLLPKDMHITHRNVWARGSHEDGYLLGLENLILLFQEIIDELKRI